MQLQQIQYSRPMVPHFFNGAKHDDLKWTINYLLTLLEQPEVVAEEQVKEVTVKGYTERINKLLSIPKTNLNASDITGDYRLEQILTR